jgi:hypothetical protein
MCQPDSSTELNKKVGNWPTQLPILRKGENLGQMWYPVKARHNKHNLSAGTDNLSLSVYQPIASHKDFKFCSGDNLEGRGGVKGLVVVPRESPP